MGVRASWSPETMDLFTAALGRRENRRFLVVERLPDGGGDWVTWHGRQAGVSRQGVADSAATAMLAAELAAAVLAPGLGLFSTPQIDVLQSGATRPN